jgi:MFS family permease
MTLTVTEYYRAYYRSVKGIVGALSFVPPLVGFTLKAATQKPNYFYPPVGDFQLITTIGTIGCMLAPTYLIFGYFSRSSGKVHAIASVILSVIGLLSFCALFCLCLRFVKVVPMSSIDTNVPVSIGYDRAEFVSSSDKLVNLPDSELLHQRGTEEDQIQLLWTMKSLIVVRICLWASYTLFLVCWISVFSIGVYQHATEGVRFILDMTT